MKNIEILCAVFCLSCSVAYAGEGEESPSSPSGSDVSECTSESESQPGLRTPVNQGSIVYGVSAEEVEPTAREQREAQAKREREEEGRPNLDRGGISVDLVALQAEQRAQAEKNLAPIIGEQKPKAEGAASRKACTIV